MTKLQLLGCALLAVLAGCSSLSPGDDDHALTAQDPNSPLSKKVRNVSANGTFADTASASPGDTIEYELTYLRGVDSQVVNLQVSDMLADGQTILECTPICERNGNTVIWFTQVVADPTTTFLVDVKLDSSFPQAVTTIDNVGTATTGGELPSESGHTTVTVNAPPQGSAFITKQVRDVSAGGEFATTTHANPGDVIEYRLTYLNNGTGPVHGASVSDTLAAGQTLDGDCGGCTVSGATLTWPLGDVGVNDPRVLTFQVKLGVDFLIGDDTIANVAMGSSTDSDDTVTSTRTTIAIKASSHLNIAKSAGLVVFRQILNGTVTYTIFYSNSGNTSAHDTVISDPLPANTTFQSCTGGCNFDGTVVGWQLDTVAPGESGMVSVTLGVTPRPGDCEVCNIAAIQSPDDNKGIATTSNEVCAIIQPVDHPELAHASGAAHGAIVGLLDLDLSPTSSEVSGIGVDRHRNELLNASVLGVLGIGTLDTQSTSVVGDSPARATDTSVATVANVNLVGGVIQAKVIRGVANATADGQSAETSAEGSTFAGLTIGGIAIGDVTPNARVDLPLGLGYVVLMEEIPHVTSPANLSLDPFAATMTVNMIHVHLLDILGNETGNIIVAQAVAHADFPQTLTCSPAPHVGTVSGHAFILGALTEPDLIDAYVDYVAIPSFGGSKTSSLVQAALPDDGAAASVAAATASTEGQVSDSDSTSSSFAEVANVCVLPIAGSCTVGAQVIRVQAQSSVSLTDTPSSNSDGTNFLGLTVLGLAVDVQVNTVIGIPGLAYVVINEQTCDNGGTLASGCSDGSKPGHTGLTVRGVHLVATVLGLVSADVVVAEAHSDATFLRQCVDCSPLQ